MNGYGTVLQGLPGRRPVHPAHRARAEVEARLKGRFMRTLDPQSWCGGPLSRHRRVRTGNSPVLMIDRPIRDEHLAWECAHAA